MELLNQQKALWQIWHAARINGGAGALELWEKELNQWNQWPLLGPGLWFQLMEWGKQNGYTESDG